MNLRAITEKIYVIKEKIADLGVEGQEISYRKVIIRTINLMVIINIAICLVANLMIYLLTDIRTVLIPSLSETFLFAFVLLLNRRHLYDQAAFIMYLTHCLSAVYFGSKFGKNADAGILILYLLVAAYLVFKTNTFRIVGMAISIVSFAMLELNYRFHYIPEWGLTTANISFIRWMIYGAVATLSGSLMYLFIQRSIQEARLTQMEIASKTEKYQMAERAKSTLLNEVTHEVSTPAHIIMQIVQKYISRVDKAEGIDRINISLDDLWVLETASNTIGDQCATVLAWAQSERIRERQISQDTFDLYTWASNLIRMYQGKARQRKLGLILNISEHTPRYIVTDRVRFNHIITNLIVNAIKFSHESTDIYVHVHHSDPNLVISVTDRGPGIPEERQAKIFEPYYTSGETVAQLESTGVGLALVKKLTELLKGTINLHSVEGEGSKFTVCIPLILPSDKELNSFIHFTDYKFDGQKVLLVDDDNFVRNASARWLSKNGCYSIEAKNAKEAIALAIQELPEVIVLDVRLPDANGAEIIRRLKANKLTEEIPIIVVSGECDENVQKCFDAGAEAYLAKPFGGLQLKKLVATFIPLNHKPKEV
ncbi:hybrid sensor histidine kinase/response regulator [Chryseobacterium gallinarum]|uniref:ATP-binding response regulator n=1 Tax=Chryseobacterium gallinarum TaxID=1324352 RepID=UPI0020240719|nr:hybrid sensor histidine kinase/response regulator [Chryseobacterium gallinarum]MCL8537631.1 hybrid sensor histidine kinase/response regulator [Chryseobacterium gallinarum]